MADGQLKLQAFRTNDLVEDSGKQVEFGTKWNQFFDIPDTEGEALLTLKFKALRSKDVPLEGKAIELKLSALTNRNDRKVYANGENGYSQIKDFFINDLQLTVTSVGKDYFALYKNGDRDYLLFYVPELLYSNFLYLFKANEVEVTVHANKSKSTISDSLQQIYYGAPGTGKSHKTDEVAALYDDTVRTTFHPDSDYSTFVGAYKPVMRPENCFGLNQDSTVELTYPANHVKQGQPIPDNKIEYKFVKQAFLKAYVRAWKKFLGQEAGEIAPQFLVIEEINRGNCAQIFGDLFQLLDRKNGFSEYPIESDEDIKNALLEDGEDSFGKEGLGLTEAWIKEINAIIGKGNDVANKIAKGEVLVLPCNLYIWATMNTSDQSLFPIDSAFKRRWDWKYMRIKDAGKNWVVDVDYTDKDGNKKPLLWWDFLEAINEQIYNTTKSEDKQLGYFFCKATKKANEEDKEPTIITPETFVGKVIFYLWQDVFKATGFRSEIFKYKKNDRDCTIKFHDFYDGDADEATNPEGINKELLATFVANVMKAQ